MIEKMKKWLEALEKSLPRLAPYGEQDWLDSKAAITSLRQAIAELESQEPVPTIEDLEQEIYQNTRNFVSLDVMEWMLKRYYTHPPQRTWVGLTDDEIIDVIHPLVMADMSDQATDYEIAKAIEAKLKEKNT